MITVVKVSLKSGMNVITWTLYPGIHKDKQALKKPLMIGSIEITGTAVAFLCMNISKGIS